MQISIPNLFVPEIKYVLQVLLRENLNIDNYIINESENPDIILKSDNGTITINNAFFKTAAENLFKEENLPSSPIKIKFEGNEIIALYGNNTVLCTNNNYYIGADIIGSSFFMLTQWESSIKKGDHLGRYKLETSTLKKYDLYKTPIVNQYIVFLQKILKKIGIETRLKDYKVEFSCDIDSITKYKSIRNLLGGMYHRRSFSTIKEYFISKNDKTKDPYFTFDYLINILEQNNINATFYFMTDVEDGEFDKADYDINDKLIQGLFAQLKLRSYKIGLHPTIHTWQSEIKILSQKNKLEQASGERILHTRQHYLRYSVVETIPIWDKLEFVTDSSIQFTEGCGFAAGMCTPYTLFDIKNRKTTGVTEFPLVFMKKKDYVNDVEKAFEEIKPVFEAARKYCGRYSILFHNSDLETENERKLFQKTIKFIS